MKNLIIISLIIVPLIGMSQGLAFDSVKKYQQKFKIDRSSKENNFKEGDPEEDQPNAFVGAMANLNFIGNNKFLSNVTPMVIFGGTIKKEHFQVDFHPYLAGQIDSKDSSSFIPSLMLPGRAGLLFNTYFNFGDTNGLQLIIMPFGFGLKLIPNVRDSNTVIFQHNYRFGLVLKYSKAFLIGAQITQGWHNTTSESYRFFKETFGKKVTDITYLMISGQFAAKGKDPKIDNYIYFEWRGLLSKKSYSPFTNIAIITIGMRKDLSLTHALPTIRKLL